MHSTNIALQIRVLSALGHLISHPKAQDRILKAGVVNQFVDYLFSDSPVLRLLAIKTIDQFVDDRRICKELIANGVLKKIVSTLNSNSGEQHRIYTLQTLTKLTIEGNQTRNTFV